MIKLGYWVWFVYYLLRTYILLVSETSEFCFAKNGSDFFIDLCLFYFLIITNASDYRLYNLCGLCIAFENYRDCNAFRLSPDMENNHYKVEGFKYDANILLGDINGDDSVTIQDATLIQKYLANIVTLLG